MEKHDVRDAIDELRRQKDEENRQAERAKQRKHTILMVVSGILIAAAFATAGTAAAVALLPDDYFSAEAIAERKANEPVYSYEDVYAIVTSNAGRIVGPWYDYDIKVEYEGMTGRESGRTGAAVIPKFSKAKPGDQVLVQLVVITRKGEVVDRHIGKVYLSEKFVSQET